jgi:hypothetical protein
MQEKEKGKEIEWRIHSGPTFVHPAAKDLRAPKKSRPRNLMLDSTKRTSSLRQGNKAQTEKDRR